MFGAETRENLRVDKNEVEDIAGCATGSVVARKKKQFHLIDGYVLEKWIDIPRAADIGVFLEVSNQSEVNDGFTTCNRGGSLFGRRSVSVYFKSHVDLGGNVSIHLICVVPMNERTEGVVLLKGIAFAAKSHPAHLAAESIDHRIAFALAVEV